MIFRGLAVPGSNMYQQNEDLVAIWMDRNGRFQNYRAIFTILNIDRISRNWVYDLLDDNPLSDNCPEVWRQWVLHGKYDALTAKPSIKYRTKFEQIPIDKKELEMMYVFSSD